MTQPPSIGRIVRFVSLRGEIVAGLVTASNTGGRVNLHLFRDGVNQAHIDPHVYEIPYAPVAPDGAMVAGSWHWPPRD